MWQAFLFYRCGVAIYKSILKIMVRFLFFFIFVTPFTLQGQNLSEIEGSWQGAIQISGSGLPIEVSFHYDGADDKLEGTLSIPAQNAYNLPVDIQKATADSLIFQFQTGTGPATFYGARFTAEDSIKGEFHQSGMAFPFSISRQSRSQSGTVHAAEEEVMIPVESGRVSGSILLTENPSPLVILLTGSGAQDRNETVAGFKIFGELASFLYDEGYSSFRFDDRGVGGSTGNTDATLQELAADVTEIADYLKDHYSEHFTDLIFLGHSQGGLIAALAAEQVKPAGIIFMASPFLPGDEVIKQQIKKISELQGVPPAIIEENLALQEEIYEAIRADSGFDAVEDKLSRRMHEQMERLPEQQRKTLGDMDIFIQNQINQQLGSAKSRGFRSLIELNPAEQIKTLDDVPMLAIFGEKDVQVLPEPNAMAAEQTKRENERVEIAIIPEANHLFQKANSGMPGEYGTLKKEFAAGFYEEILRFLEQIGD